MVEKLVELCSLDVGHVSAGAACTLRDVLRKHVVLRALVSPVLCGCLKFIEDGEGRAAIIWMLGEVGEVVTEAPYVLEKVVDAWEDQPAIVKLSLLTTCMRLFFKRPGEMQNILGKALTRGVGDVGDQDLHDRALYYYRLLQVRPSEASCVVCGRKLGSDGAWLTGSPNPLYSPPPRRAALATPRASLAACRL